MNYSEFEYKLINDVFRTAVFICKEYDGLRHIIIQRYGDVVYMITIDKTETIIRVSYPDCQKIYGSYDEALDKITKHFKAGDREEILVYVTTGGTYKEETLE